MKGGKKCAGIADAEKRKRRKNEKFRHK